MLKCFGDAGRASVEEFKEQTARKLGKSAVRTIASLHASNSTGLTLRDVSIQMSGCCAKLLDSGQSRDRRTVGFSSSRPTNNLRQLSRPVGKALRSCELAGGGAHALESPLVREPIS